MHRGVIQVTLYPGPVYVIRLWVFQSLSSCLIKQKLSSCLSKAKVRHPSSSRGCLKLLKRAKTCRSTGTIYSPRRAKNARRPIEEQRAKTQPAATTNLGEVWQEGKSCGQALTGNAVGTQNVAGLAAILMSRGTGRGSHSLSQVRIHMACGSMPQRQSRPRASLFHPAVGYNITTESHG